MMIPPPPPSSEQADNAASPARKTISRLKRMDCNAGKLPRGALIIRPGVVVALDRLGRRLGGRTAPAPARDHALTHILELPGDADGEGVDHRVMMRARMVLDASPPMDASARFSQMSLSAVSFRCTRSG